MTTVTHSNPLLCILLIVLTTLDGVRFVNSASASIFTTSTSHDLTTTATTVRNRVNLIHAVKMSRKFSCKEPQPRAYHLHDLMETNHVLSSDENANQPPYIMAKRCDGHSGCCMNLVMVCAPNVTYYEDIEIEIWNGVTNVTRRQWITVEQHGRCSCEFMDHSDRQRLETQKPNVTLLR